VRVLVVTGGFTLSAGLVELARIRGVSVIQSPFDTLNTVLRIRSAQFIDPVVEREFVTAAELDVRFDYAGPARGLGELYFQAPGWPFSVGNKRKAHEWLERAITLAPEYPGNHLNLAEAQWQWRETDAFATTMKNLESQWPSAKTNFTGEAWEPCWADWNARRTALRSEFQKKFKTVPGS